MKIGTFRVNTYNIFSEQLSSIFTFTVCHVCCEYLTSSPAVQAQQSEVQTEIQTDF